MKQSRLYRASSRVLAIGVAQAALWSPAAMAQTATAVPAPVETASSDATPLGGDIVVTARRKAESLQDVPLSVSAFSDKTLIHDGVTSLADLNHIAPSLNFQSAGGRGTDKNRLFLRGLTTGLTGSSKTSVFIDGVYVAGDYSFVLLNPTMLDHVEVLAGPQSAQFGRTSFSGAVNFVTKAPSDHLTGSFVSEAATLGQAMLAGYISGPLAGDRLTGSLSGSYSVFGGPDRWRTASGYSIGDQQTEQVEAKVAFEATPNLKLTALGSYNRDRDHMQIDTLLDPSVRNADACSTTRPNGTVARYICGTIPTVYDGLPNTNYNLNGLDPIGLLRNTYRGYLSADWSVAGHTVTVTGSHDDEKVRNNYDVDATSFENIRFKALQSRVDNSAELRITSPQNQRFRYTVGAYYLDLDYRLENNYVLVNTISSAGVLSTPNIAVHVLSLTNTQNKSAFGAFFFDVTSKLTASFEGRYQDEYISSANLLTKVTYANHFKAFLPRATLQYKFTPAVQVYALYSKGNNPGLFNPGLVNDESQRVVPEEKLFNYEAGIKSTWLDGKLLFNLSAYHMDWKNIQSSRSISVNGVSVGIQESHGSAKIDGFELLAEVNPIRGLSIRGNASLARGRYVSFCSINAALILGRSDLPAPDSCLYVNGNHLEGSPEWQGSLSADYSWAMKDGLEAFVRGQYSYTDGMYDSEMNFAKSRAANVIDASTGLSQGRLGVELFVKNLTQEDAPVRVIRFPDPRLTSNNANNSSIDAFPRTPRQIGIRTTYRF